MDLIVTAPTSTKVSSNVDGAYKTSTNSKSRFPHENVEFSVRDDDFRRRCSDETFVDVGAVDAPQSEIWAPVNEQPPLANYDDFAPPEAGTDTGFDGYDSRETA